jgi:hypothetical protein
MFFLFSFVFCLGLIYPQSSISEGQGLAIGFSTQSLWPNQGTRKKSQNLQLNDAQPGVALDDAFGDCMPS